jgi:hypothetical protein
MTGPKKIRNASLRGNKEDLRQLLLAVLKDLADDVVPPKEAPPIGNGEDKGKNGDDCVI